MAECSAQMEPAPNERWGGLSPSADWLPRASVGLGIAATIAMNVTAGSRGGPGGVLIGTLPPAGLVISLEILILLVRKLARKPWGWAWCLGAGIPLAGLALITGVISYLHALTVAEWTGDPAEAGLVLTEHLLPLVADLMILTGSVALVALAVAAKPKPAVKPERSQEKTKAEKPERKPKPERTPTPGSRVIRPLEPGPQDPPLEELQAAYRDGMGKRDLAAAHGMTTWRAERLLKYAASANGSATN